MELAGFVVGLAGIMISIGQYLNSRQNKRTIRNWGSTLVRQHESASIAFAGLAERIESADREQWRSMQPEVLGTVRRSGADADNMARQVKLYIDTVAGPRRPARGVATTGHRPVGQEG